MNEVSWTDVAPRDGLQNIAETIGTEAKIRLVRGLLDAGVPRVEATSFVSPSWVPQLADAPAVLAGLHPELGRLRVLIPNLRGLELALAHGMRNVLVTIAATDTFNRRNVNRSVDESLDEISHIVELAGERGLQRRRRRLGELRMSVRGSGRAGTRRRAVRGPVMRAASRRWGSPTRSAWRLLPMSARCVRSWPYRCRSIDCRCMCTTRAGSALPT